MALEIYSYPNPYDLDSMTIWDAVKDVPQFCVSQTMVNGLTNLYKHFDQRTQLATVQKLINALYSDWESIDVKVRQIVSVDRAINALTITGEEADRVKKSLLFNTKPIANCIRLLKELNIKSGEINTDHLNIGQRYLVEIFKIVEDEPAFLFSHAVSCERADAAIREALKNREGEQKFDGIDFGTIVIHGVHQFTPAIICAIDELSKYYRVILLFNYQHQYRKIYETWLNVYSLFEVPMHLEKEGEFVPNALYANSYQSNLLADFIGKAFDGNLLPTSQELSNLEVIEFENCTEFANYVASIYQKAKAEGEKASKPPLALMSEQFYAASRKVNDILRAYFPEQFGERHFLDYPFGHFFVAIMEMWDSDTNQAVVDNFSLIKECFNSGAISENKPGELVNTFNKVLPYFENERTLVSIIDRVKTLYKNVGTNDPIKVSIGYYDVTKDELKYLLIALNELNNLINLFFDGYKTNPNAFKDFYARVQKFIISKMEDPQDLDEMVRPVVAELLQKLEGSSFNGTATFNCLKQTMSFYLGQNESVNFGAHWIVRGFEQIDGDILRTASDEAQEKVYHFACLSDKDICAAKDARLPWPLDVEFFRRSTVPLDWKYQIFYQSKLEFPNFYRYALLYGLQFNRTKFKLSYIKEENQKDNDLFFILKLLGAKIKPYKSFETGVYVPPFTFTAPLSSQPKTFSRQDRIKATMCLYRFISEDMVTGRIVFRDRFLVHTFMRVLICNRVLEKLQGEAFSEGKTKQAIDESYQFFSDKFKLSNELERAELVAAVFKDLKYWCKGKPKMYPILAGNHKLESGLKLKEIFLMAELREFEGNPLKSQKIEDALANGKIRPTPGAYCKYCASKGTCLEYRK